MSAIAVKAPEAIVAKGRRDLSGWTKQQLDADLANHTTMTLEGLVFIGENLAERQRRGDDIRGLVTGFCRFALEVGYGRLAAEAVMAFMGEPAKISALVGMPLGEQRDLVSGKLKIKVVDPENAREVHEKSFADMAPTELRLAIRGGKILSPADQRLSIRSKPKDKAGDDRQYSASYDSNAGIVKIGNSKATIKSVLGAIAQQVGPLRPLAEDVKEEFVIVRVKLSQEEFRTLQAKCASSGDSESTMARMALHALGMI